VESKGTQDVSVTMKRYEKSKIFLWIVFVFVGSPFCSMVSCMLAHFPGVFVAQQ